MSLKLKALGLGLLAVMAMSAFAAVNASATINGHFTSTTDDLILTGTDQYGTKHQLVFKETGSSGVGISCTDSHYHGALSGDPATTSTSVQLTPTYKNCATESGTWGDVTVKHDAGCDTKVYKFHSRTPNGHGTVTVECGITISHPNCTIRVPKQNPSGGIVYTTSNEGGSHEITADVTVTNIIGQYEGGICVFLGTNHTFTMNGSVTLWGLDAITGARVPVTAT